MWRVSVKIPCSRMIITTETQNLNKSSKNRIEQKKTKKQTVKMELSISPLQPDSDLISEKKNPEWIIFLFSLHHTAADGWNTVLGERKTTPSHVRLHQEKTLQQRNG